MNIGAVDDGMHMHYIAHSFIICFFRFRRVRSPYAIFRSIAFQGRRATVCGWIIFFSFLWLHLAYSSFVHTKGWAHSICLNLPLKEKNAVHFVSARFRRCWSEFRRQRRRRRRYADEWITRLNLILCEQTNCELPLRYGKIDREPNTARQQQRYSEWFSW